MVFFNTFVEKSYLKCNQKFKKRKISLFGFFVHYLAFFITLRTCQPSKKKRKEKLHFLLLGPEHQKREEREEILESKHVVKGNCVFCKESRGGNLGWGHQQTD